MDGQHQENVSAFASRYLKEFPCRLHEIEAEHDEQVHLDDDDQSLDVPVIDMKKLMDNQIDELQRLHLACKKWGFFKLINHEVPDGVVEKMRNAVQAFYKLEMENKEADGCEVYGQASECVVSKGKKLDLGSILFLNTQPPSSRDLSLWPKNPTSFRDALDDYSKNLQTLMNSVLIFIARNLGLNSDSLKKLFENGSQGIGMNYYPPCKGDEDVIGLVPHSDATGLTLLLHVNEVEGLQIKKDGNWVSVKPTPGAFVVNIGDILEIMTDGTCKSIEHRAVLNPHKERISMAAFHNPSMSTLIGPLPELALGSVKYKTLDQEEYMRTVVRRKLDGKSRLDMMKLG